MESKKIRIKIVSEKYDDAPKPERSEMMTEAELVREGGKTRIEYSESEITGMDGAKTIISFADNAPSFVTMERHGGGFSMSFAFEKGKQHSSLYRTPIMTFDMSVLANEVQNRLAVAGYILLDYTLDIGGAGASRNRVYVSIMK